MSNKKMGVLESRFADFIRRTAEGLVHHSKADLLHAEQQRDAVIALPPGAQRASVLPAYGRRRMPQFRHHAGKRPPGEHLQPERLLPQRFAAPPPSRQHARQKRRKDPSKETVICISVLVLHPLCIRRIHCDSEIAFFARKKAYRAQKADMPIRLELYTVILCMYVCMYVCMYQFTPFAQSPQVLPPKPCVNFCSFR